MVPVFIEDPEKTSNSVEAIFDDTNGYFTQLFQTD